MCKASFNAFRPKSSTFFYFFRCFVGETNGVTKDKKGMNFRGSNRLGRKN